jgi:diguanylate cyclase (GGDEF)-like protein
VLLIDIDQFKAINEGLGREAGDQVLQEVAKRLLDAVRGNDLVARLVGDEFVVIAECRNGATSASRVATKVVEALSRPLIVAGRDVGVTASIGISLYPQDGTSCDSLFQNADTALYSAKLTRDSGSSLRFYTAEMSSQSKSRMLLLSALRVALEKNQFTVYYQPRVDLRSMEVVGMEALLRWNHPELGAVSPAQFIPLAEEAGLIEPIGAWVLKEATRQAVAWSKLHNRPFRMSVNVSARQLRSSLLVETVVEALTESGLPANQLELELTETALMVDTALAGKLLTEVRGLGVHLSVDDFGTGYSSLSYLSMFPLDCLKLDKSFLEHRPNAVNPQKLAKAIINLAHSLNLTVVAEGVETREHLGFLRGAACDEIQGFCISVPLPPEEFEQFIHNTHTSFRFDEDRVLKGRASR